MKKIVCLIATLILSTNSYSATNDRNDPNYDVRQDVCSTYAYPSGLLTMRNVMVIPDGKDIRDPSNSVIYEFVRLRFQKNDVEILKAREFVE